MKKLREIEDLIERLDEARAHAALWQYKVAELEAKLKKLRPPETKTRRER